MDQTGEMPDMEGIAPISYDKLVESLSVEQKAHTRIAAQLAQAGDMRQELEFLLQSNSGKRPQCLPGVSRKRREELDMDFRIESKGEGLTKDDEELVYQPRFRPCCCGCGELVLGELWTCSGEMTPLQLRALHADAPPPNPAGLARAQRMQSERLARPRPKPAEPAEASPTQSSSPPRKVDRARLERIALPRELPPEPKPPTPLPKARPAPPRLAPSASEPAISPTAERREQREPRREVRLAPLEKRKVIKLSPTKSDLPGLSVLLHKASVVSDKQKARLVPESDEEFWANRGHDLIRTHASQQKYVEARLYPKSGAAKTGTVAELEQRLEKVRQERMALERQLQEGPEQKPRPRGAR